MESAGLVVSVIGVLSLALITEAAVAVKGTPIVSSGIKWDDLKVGFQVVNPGKFTIPLSSSTIGSEYQFLKVHEELPLVSLYCYKGDPRVCFMYDAKKNICGIRVAYIIAHLKDRTPKGSTFPYSYDNKPIFKKGSAMGLDIYYVDFFFIRPDVLKTGGPASRAEPVGTGVYINIDGKTWMEMPRNEQDTKNTGFTKQGCFVGMGLHYFYKMTKTMKCEDHNPVFLLYNGGHLIGVGLVPLGTFDHNFGRPWFEDPPKMVINSITPNGPTCLTDWVGTYGATAIHIYFHNFNAINC